MSLGNYVLTQQSSHQNYYGFHSLISKDEMKRLTRSEDCSQLPVDSLYLPWTMMKWNFVGEIREFNIKKSDLCSNTDNSVSVFFPSKEGFRNKLVSKFREDTLKDKIDFLNLVQANLKISIHFFNPSMICLFNLQKYFNGKSVWIPVPS